MNDFGQHPESAPAPDHGMPVVPASWDPGGRVTCSRAVSNGHGCCVVSRFLSTWPHDLKRGRAWVGCLDGLATALGELPQGFSMACKVMRIEG
jgi:hypothetical protein